MSKITTKLAAAYHGAVKSKSIRVDGLEVISDPARIGPDMARWLYKGKYEKYESGIVAATVRPGDRVLDIGGGVGFVAMIAARAAGPHGAVRVYEPNPDLIALIEKNAETNGLSLDVRQAAVARQGGRGDMHLAEWFVASSLNPVEGARKVEVEIAAFADIVSEFKPTFVIVDVEGAELDLFDDADMSGVRAVCLELHPAAIGRDGASRPVAKLIEMGFAIDFDRSRKDVYYFDRVDA